ncbi:hypothetical protein CBR_g20347 [Chara braunii]|uniref:Alpha/beta hydrolase fold-5 domain-containing protein n=1 Tax=Chara braunii TaxID=69332 RepID=A0A388JUB8_CHABU|nr:hypothetical protein CBR_g20347 [Chara braunii]|eukprot:GBG61312.1 hypothetical protein CBR_g20347 [Chara braunii]
MGSNPFPTKGHYDFAYSTCRNNSILGNATSEGGNGTGGSSTAVMETVIVGEDVVVLRRLPVRMYQATARALSYGDNTLLQPGQNESKVYPPGGMPVEQITLPVPTEMPSNSSKLEKPRRNMWVFKPNATRGGLIYFPGAFVDARAYFPLAFQISTRGYMVVIPQMSRRIALEPIVAEDILRSTGNHTILSIVPEDKWAVGGHSFGGICAFNYAASSTRHRLAALVMHSGAFSTLARGGPAANLTLSPLPVTQIYGTLDGLFGDDPDSSKYQAIEPPPRGFGLVVNKTATTFIAVEGANHHQVGDYGYQLGSRVGLIGQEEQQRIYAELTVKQLDKAMGYA